MYGLCVILAITMAQADGAFLSEPESSARPEWTQRHGWSQSPIRYRVVSSERWATREEALKDAVARAVPVAQEFAAEANPRITPSWQVPPRVIYDRLVRDEHVETVDWTYGSMYRAHLLLELSPERRDNLISEWRQWVLERRLTQLGAGLGFVLICLSSVLGYLRLDEATRGYYSGWLRAGLVATVAGSAAVLYTWIV